MSKINCGVIGLGRLGKKHAETLLHLPNACLKAISDPAIERMESFKEWTSGIKMYPDYHDLLADKDITAVVIASSTRTHSEIILEAVRQDKYIFCEKPLCLSLDEGRQILSASERYKAFIQLGFMRRFDPAYREAQNRLQSGEMGLPVYIHCISRDPCAPELAFAKDSGGLILDMCIHDIDLCRWLMASEITEVYARGGVLLYDFLAEIGDIDQGCLLLTFSNGSMGYVEGSRNAKYGYDVRTEIVCTKGALSVGQWHNTSCIILNQNGCHRDVVPWFMERFATAYYMEMKNFIDSILKGREPEVNEKDGWLALMIALAAVDSITNNKSVSVVG